MVATNLKDLMIGGTAGIVSRTCISPIELYRIQRQNSFMPDSNLRSVIRKEGFRYVEMLKLDDIFKEKLIDELKEVENFDKWEIIENNTNY